MSSGERAPLTSSSSSGLHFSCLITRTHLKWGIRTTNGVIQFGLLHLPEIFGSANPVAAHLVELAAHVVIAFAGERFARQIGRLDVDGPAAEPPCEIGVLVDIEETAPTPPAGGEGGEACEQHSPDHVIDMDPFNRPPPTDVPKMAHQSLIPGF